MKTSRQKASLVLDIIIAVMVFYAWARMIFQWGDNGTISAGGFRNLRYFTVLSNLLMAAASILNIVYTIIALKLNKEIPSWVSKLRYAGASAVALTLLVVLLFLWPVFHVPGLYSGANLFMHLIIPIMGGLSFVLGGTETLKLKESFISVVPMLIYGAWYIGNNAINGIGEWPDTNDWYGFLSWGWGPGLIIFAVLILMTWGVALIMRYIHNRFLKE
jgi:hypothetical protein